MARPDPAGPHIEGGHKGKSFPVGDPTHARLALAFVDESERKGHITPEQAHHIRSAAHSELAEHHKKLGAELMKKK